MKILGIISGIALPFFNIPLIMRIVQRRTSDDISLVWVVGVWVCAVGMLPSSLRSPDPVLSIFGVINIIFFTGVFATVIYFRKRPGPSTTGSPAPNPPETRNPSHE